MAKCHFRKGQAFYGLGDARGAVDAYNDAIALEERQLDKCATDESKKKAATIVSMKRELLKARRAAKEQAKTAASQLSGARGFLKAGARGTGDPKEERKQLIVEKIDCALSFVFSDKDTKGKDAETAIAGAGNGRDVPDFKGSDLGRFPLARLICGRAIMSRNGLDAWMLIPERARAAHSR